MSLASRARNPKRPTPESGRPRRYGALMTHQPLDLHAFQKVAHEANANDPMRHAQGGGHSVVARWPSVPAAIERAAAAALVKAPEVKPTEPAAEKKPHAFAAFLGRLLSFGAPSLSAP